MKDFGSFFFVEGCRYEIYNAKNRIDVSCMALKQSEILEFSEVLERTMASQNCPAKKQIAILGQFIILVFLAAVFFRLRVIDSMNYLEDFQTIRALGSFAQLPVHKILVSQYKSDIEFRNKFDLSIQGVVISGLNQDIDESRLDVRTSIIKWLKDNKVPANELNDLSGKEYGGKRPFLFFRSAIPQLNTPLKEEANVDSDPPIELLLQEIKHLKSTTLVVVDKLQDSNLPELDFMGQSSYVKYSLDSVFLSKDANLLVTFVKKERQQTPEPKVIKIPVDTKSIRDVNVLELLTAKQYQKRFKTLLSNKAAFEQLRKTYGTLQLKSGVQICGQRMLDSYQDVEMLGFKFSPRYFWVFIFAFHIVFLLANAVHVKSSVVKKEQETMTFGLDILLRNKIAHVALWCVLPVLSLVLACPQQHWSFFTGLGYCSAIAIIVALGLRVTFWRKRQ